MPRQRHQIRVAEAIADLDRLTQGFGRPGSVTLVEISERGGQEQIAVLDANVLGFVEQTLGPRDLGAAASMLSAGQESVGQPERASDRSGHISTAQELVVRARPDIGALVVLAQQVCGRRESLEVLRFQRDLLICGRQVGVYIGHRRRPKDSRPSLTVSAGVITLLSQ